MNNILGMLWAWWILNWTHLLADNMSYKYFYMWNRKHIVIGLSYDKLAYLVTLCHELFLNQCHVIVGHDVCDGISQHRPGLKLASSHHLKQFWLITTGVLWHSMAISQIIFKSLIFYWWLMFYNSLRPSNTIWWQVLWSAKSPRSHWVKGSCAILFICW